MTQARQEELEAKLMQKGRELLELVGDDLPTKGHISISAWKDSIYVEIRKYWEDAPKNECAILAHYERISA